MRKQIVRLISLDPRYRVSPYPAIAEENSRLDTYLTGQHVDPDDESTVGGLTKEEMLGDEKLTVAKRNRFPFVVNPKTRVPLTHSMRFDLSKDDSGEYIKPKDKAIYDFVKLQRFVAYSKEEYVKSKHYFYLEDKEQEASARVTKRDKRFKAEKLVRENTASGRLIDVATMLSYNLNNFNIDTDYLSKTQVEDALYDACEKYPENVINCYSKDAEEDMFIIKLAKHKIISKTDDGFYDGSKFIGMTLGEVKSFTSDKENESYVSKWGKLLENKTGATKGTKTTTKKQ